MRENIEYTFTRFSSDENKNGVFNQDGVRQHGNNEIHKKTDGYLLVRADGRIDFLGFWESVQHWLGLRDADYFVSKRQGNW